MMLGLIFWGALALSWWLTERVRQRLLAKAIMDVPNDRSMHKIPVPRGGGLAVMAVIGGGIALSSGVAFSFPSLFLLAALGLLMGVSWADDKKGLGPGVRLASHLAAALIGSFALGDQAMAFGGLLPFWLDRALVVLGWGWFMNLYNFMDGIDGITGVQTISCTAGAALLLSLADLAAPADLGLAALIAGACAGFLIHNWHPAKIFLGDVGSVPLGFLIGFLLLKLAVGGHPIAALIVPLYYLADSGITIVGRALRREKIWQPHRLHFYQRATAAIGHPVLVVLWIALANAGLILAGGLALSHPLWGLALGVAVTALLLAKMQLTARKSRSP